MHTYGPPVASCCHVYIQTEILSLPYNTSYFFSPTGKIALFYILVEETLIRIKYVMFSRITGVSFYLMLQHQASSQILHIIERLHYYALVAHVSIF